VKGASDTVFASGSEAIQEIPPSLAAHFWTAALLARLAVTVVALLAVTVVGRRAVK